jgi:hypothetical protein
MLMFNIPDMVDFATDTETGEVFGLASTKEVDTVRGIYVRDGKAHASRWASRARARNHGENC